MTTHPEARTVMNIYLINNIFNVMASAEQDSGPEVIDNDRQFNAFHNKN